MFPNSKALNHSAEAVTSPRREKNSIDLHCVKCQNMEFFLVQIQEDMDQKKIRILTLFT